MLKISVAYKELSAYFVIIEALTCPLNSYL